MNRTKITYKHLILFFVAFTLLGAIYYAPYVKKQQSNHKEERGGKGHAQQELSVSNHVCTSPLIVTIDIKFIHDFFQTTSFGLPFQVKHKIQPVLFTISYWDNLFPYTIAAQAP